MQEKRKIRGLIDVQETVLKSGEMMVSSLCINAKACDLREIRSRGEVQHVHVIKDVVSVEPAKNEEPRVGEERSMVTSWRRGPAESRPRLVLQGHCFSANFKILEFQRPSGEVGLPRLKRSSSGEYSEPSCPPDIKR